MAPGQSRARCRTSWACPARESATNHPVRGRIVGAASLPAGERGRVPVPFTAIRARTTGKGGRCSEHEERHSSGPRCRVRTTRPTGMVSSRQTRHRRPPAHTDGRLDRGRCGNIWWSRSTATTTESTRTARRMPCTNASWAATVAAPHGRGAGPRSPAVMSGGEARRSGPDAGTGGLVEMFSPSMNTNERVMAPSSSRVGPPDASQGDQAGCCERAETRRVHVRARAARRPGELSRRRRSHGAAEVAGWMTTDATPSSEQSQDDSEQGNPAPTAPAMPAHAGPARRTRRRSTRRRGHRSTNVDIAGARAAVGGVRTTQQGRPAPTPPPACIHMHCHHSRDHPVLGPRRRGGRVGAAPTRVPADQARLPLTGTAWYEPAGVARAFPR